jgi:hypothetical protein
MAVEGKRSTATVVLDNGGRRQRSSLTMVAVTGGDSDGIGWNVGSYTFSGFSSY